MLLLLLVVGISACSPEGDRRLSFQVEFLPVESIEMPEYMSSGQTYQLKVYYKRPHDCHYYDGFYTETDNQSQILAVQTLVIQNATCESLLNEPSEYAFYEFKCPLYDELGTFNNVYEFKIYKGDDEEGRGVFETVQVPISQ